MSKRIEELTALRELSEDALVGKGNDLEEELLKLRFKAAAGQLEHTAQLNQLRRSVARVRTLLAERTAGEAA